MRPGAAGLSEIVTAAPVREGKGGDMGDIRKTY